MPTTGYRRFYATDQNIHFSSITYSTCCQLAVLQDSLTVDGQFSFLGNATKDYIYIYIYIYSIYINVSAKQRFFTAWMKIRRLYWEPSLSLKNENVFFFILLCSTTALSNEMSNPIRQKLAQMC